jgi:hypothetical protein
VGAVPPLATPVGEGRGVRGFVDMLVPGRARRARTGSTR